MFATTESHDDPISFRAAVDGYLRANLAACNQIFTITQGLTAESIKRNRGWLVRLHRGGETCGVCLIHSAPPTRRLLVSDLDDECAAAIGSTLDEAGIELSAVVGPPDSVARLAKYLGANTVERVRLGNHALDTPPLIPACPGDARVATTDHFELLLRWESAFCMECGLPENVANLDKDIGDRLADAACAYWLWVVDGVPAAMALARARSPAARIGMVYTTPEHRGRGYAGALVGNVSRTLLATGCEAVFLYTDLANPTSNGVYRRIGFRRIGELVHLDILKRDNA
jgi:ribosomal protein S18 acetylase RimI-like enzyme